MGIGVQALRLMADLRDRGLLRGRRGVLEFGSQTFAPDSAAAQAALAGLMPDLDARSILTPRDLYRALGLERYVAIDLDGHDGALAYDLNRDLETAYGFSERFDLLTNHGTTEHAFDQRKCFENAHKATAVGGLMLHALPSQGYQNHAFFNYHPSFFLDLAAANDYEVLGLWYNLDEELYAYTDGFLAENEITATQFTAIFALLRKRRDAPFVVPFDGRYYVEEQDGKLIPRRDVGGHERVAFNALPVSASYPALRIALSRRDTAPRIRFVLPVWGAAFVEAFLRFGLRAQLANGSLDLPATPESEYLIVTDAAGASRMKQSPELDALRERMRVSFRIIDVRSRRSYSQLTHCYNLALSDAVEDDIYVFLTSDCFFSREVFGRALARMANSRLVLSPALRVVEESFIADIAASSAWDVDGRTLLRLALRHEHPLTEAFTLDNRRDVSHPLPAQMLARLPTGYVGRWTVMHPLAIRITTTLPRIVQTIDWNYGAMQITGWRDVAVLDTIEDGLTVSTTPFSYDQGERFCRGAGARQHRRNLCDWLQIPWALEFHLAQMAHPVRLLADPEEDPAVVVAAETRVVQVMAGVFAYADARRRVPREDPDRLSAAELLRPAMDVRRSVLANPRIFDKAARKLGGRAITRLRRVFGD
jgi:hypothetical protein